MTGKQFGFSFDIVRCSGCMACMVACFDQNDMPGNESTFRHVTKIEAGEYPAATIQYVSLACMHCGDAPCIAVCPTKAISRKPDNGIVVVSRESCIGCHACATVCPFGAPQFPDGTLMSKCDLCVARIESGLEPACARTCPTKSPRVRHDGEVDRGEGEKGVRGDGLRSPAEHGHHSPMNMGAYVLR